MSVYDILLLYASYSLSEEKRNGIHFVGNVSRVDIQTETPIERTSSEDTIEKSNSSTSIYKKWSTLYDLTYNRQSCILICIFIVFS